MPEKLGDLISETMALARKPYADKLMQVRALADKFDAEAKALSESAIGDDWGIVITLERCARELRATLDG